MKTENAAHTTHAASRAASTQQPNHEITSDNGQRATLNVTDREAPADRSRVLFCSLSTTAFGMSTLPRADRGGAAEVSSNARLDAEAAEGFRKRIEEGRMQSEARKQHRESCLQDSAMVGAGAGSVGASLAVLALRRPQGIGQFKSLLGISVTGKKLQR